MARFFSDAAVTKLLLLPTLVALSVRVTSSRRMSRRAAFSDVEWARARPDRDPTGGAGPSPMRRYSNSET
jgi:hypothetical protein